MCIFKKNGKQSFYEHIYIYIKIPMLPDVASVFNTASAYLSVAATSNPPPA
jgi:hypothetical protein